LSSTVDVLLSWHRLLRQQQHKLFFQRKVLRNKKKVQHKLFFQLQVLRNKEGVID
jgi:hypothetical protein